MVDKENYVAEIYSHIQREPQLSETYANFFQDNDLTADTIAQGPRQNDSSEINSSIEEKKAIKIIIVPSSNESNQQIDLGQQEYYENCQEQAYVGNSSNSLKMDIEEDRNGKEEGPKENNTENMTTEFSSKENQLSSQVKDIYIPMKKWDKIKSEDFLFENNSNSNSNECLDESMFNFDCNCHFPEYSSFYEIEDANPNSGTFMNNFSDETKFETEGHPG